MRIRRILQIAAVVSIVSVLVVFVVLFSQRATDARHSLESHNLSEAVRKITLLLSLLQEPLGIQNERTASQWQAHYDELTPTLQALPALETEARSLKLRILQEHASIGALFKRLATAGQEDVAGDFREMIGGQLVVRTASMVSDVLAIKDLTDGFISRDRQRMMAVMAGAVAFLAGVVVILLLVLHRRVVAPITALAGATEELRAGRLDRSVQVSGRDEVGELALSFEHMRVSLQDRLKDLAETNSQLREAREEAEKRAAELDAAFTSLAEGVVLYSTDHQITYLNPSAERILGFRIEDVHGKPASERVKLFTLRNIDGGIPTREEMTGWRALHGETVSGEEFSVLSRNSEVPIHLLSSAAPIRMNDGRTVGAIQTLADITGRKHAEESLRESEGRYRALINASSQVLYRMSPDWSEMRRLKGGSFIADTEEPNRNWLPEYIYPDDQETVQKAIKEAVQTGSVFELTHRVRRVDGTLGWVSSRAVPIRDASLEVVEWFGAASDITDRKRAEEQVVSMAKFPEQDPYPVLRFGMDGSLVYANTASRHFLDQTGCRVNETTCSRGLLDLIKKAAECAELQSEELSMGDKTYLLTAMPIPEMGYVNLYATDMTGLKRTEKALRESERRLTRAQAISHLGSWTWNLEDDSVAWSDELYNIFGVEKATFSLSLEAIAELIHPEDRPLHQRWLAQFLDGRVHAPLECRVVRPNGETRSVLAFADLELPDPKHAARRLSGTVLDITDRKRAEDALREREELLQLFVEHVPAAMAMFDTDMKYIAVSHRWLSDYGLGRQTLSGRSHYDVFPEIPEHWKATYRRCLAGAVERSEGEPFERTDGSVQWIRWEVRPWHTAMGAIGGVILFSEDITERHGMEEELRRSRDELENRVEERTQELAAANKELEAFSYSVSHDLRAPLQTISGFSRFLFDDYADKLDEEGAHYLQRLRAATEHMSRLIDDILKLSRLSRTQLMLETVDLSDLARDVVAGLRERNPSRTARVTIAPDLRVKGDKGLLRVILENLLGNAWKFTEKEPDAAIELQVSQQGGESVYCIRDNGAGFDMKFAGKLFIPFSRLHTQAEFSGAGIGLALVQRILNRHGGRIWAESEPGKGATFCFTLPN